MKNTAITYMYCDGSNHKQYGEYIVSGKITFKEVEDCLDEGEFFIASQIGFKDLQLGWKERNYDFPTDDDHVYCKLDLFDFNPTDRDPTIGITAEQLKCRFEAAKGNWDISGAESRLGMLTL